jgi:uncharacterized protein
MPEKISNIHRIGVISDTHIPTRATQLPAAVFSGFKDVDLIIHCGDLVEKSVLIELNVIAPVYAVRGNMDGEEIHAPDELVLDINEKFILCIAHGIGPKFGTVERLYKKFREEKPYMLIFGHTHVPEMGNYSDVLTFNPGSATNGSDYNSIGMLEIKQDKIDRSIIRL